MALRPLALVTLAVFFAACPPAPAPDSGLDAGAEEEDAGFDAGVDAGRDAGPVDSGVDAGPADAGFDAGLSDGGCVYRLDQFGGTWFTARPLAIELADMNGDGHLDFVLATTSALELRLNDTFGAPVSPSWMGPITPQTLVVTDVDGDGLLDVVSVDGVGVLTVVRGDGDGGLSLGTRLDAGQPFFVPQDTAMADVDLDGRQDFVTLDVGGSIPELRTVRGFFDGGAPRVTNGSHRLVLADVTGDGFIDALVGNAQYGLALHRGDGDGGFTLGPVALASTAVNSVALTDVTGDGVPDAVCASGYFDGTLTTGGGVTVLAGEDGGFGAPAAEPSTREIIWAVVMADMNRDGQLDAVTSQLGTDAGVRILAGDGGRFSPLTRFPGRNGWAIAVGDLNEDGWPDVVVGTGSGASGEVRVLVGSCQ